MSALISSNTITNVFMHLSTKFSTPLSVRLFFSVRGTENLHVYLWLLKDLFWCLGYVYASSAFGSLALIFTASMFVSAFKMKNTEEMYFLVHVFVWLFSNFWWMRSELAPTYYNTNGREQSGYMLFGANIFAMLYYIIFKWRPVGFFKNNESIVCRYENAGFKPYFTYFENWRQYEFLHITCWALKDQSWMFKTAFLWVPSVILTLSISVDFIRVALKTQKNATDLTHYIVQLLWLSGNIIWSAGEIFNITPDTINPLFYPNSMSCRWVASIVFTVAFVPILVFYMLWIPLSYYELIRELDEESFEWRGVEA